jgi:hypothetical protein
VELFEEIRRGYAAGETIRDWRRSMACTGGWCGRRSQRDPAERKSGGTGSSRRLGPVKEHIDRMLEADRQAPRKQRHTAHRIWTRLRKSIPSTRSGSHRAALRAATEARTGAERPGSVRAAELRVGPGSAGGLVRSDGQAGRRSCASCSSSRCAAWVGRRLPSGLHARHAAGVAGSARACLRLFRRRVPHLRYDNMTSW